MENCGQKIAEVLQWFRACNIRNIIHDREGELNLPFIEPAHTCTCYACRWNNQEYSGIRKGLSSAHVEQKDKIDQAYAAYELSEYRKAIDILLQVIEQAKAENNQIRIFICQYNIRLLKQQHNHTKFSQQFPDPLETVDAFNIEDTIHLLPKEDQEIAQWLNSDLIYDEYSLAILQDGQMLRKALHSKRSLSGNNINEFFRKFYDVWRFLTANRIVGDQLAEFTNIYQAFQEGLFVMLALYKMKGNEKIVLPEQYLKAMVRYGQYQVIQELLTEYRVVKISHSNGGHEKFVESFLRLIDEIALYPTNELFNQGPQYFREQMNRMLDVYAILSQYIGLTAGQINSIAQKLLEYSQAEESDSGRRFYSAITHFLTWQGNIIEKRILADFVIQYIQKNKFLDFNSVEILLANLDERKTSITFSSDSSKVIHELVFRALVYDDADTLSHLLRLACLSSEENDVVKINGILAEFLSEKFLPQPFSVARITEYLIDNSVLLGKYLAFMEQYVKNLAPRDEQHHFDLYGTDLMVDQFLNLQFKEQFPIPDSIAAILRKRCPYYRWLFDPEGYDYRQFEVEWVWHAFTIYYQRHFIKSAALRLKLHEVFTETKRPDIANLLIKLYVSPQPQERLFGAAD